MSAPPDPDMVRAVCCTLLLIACLLAMWGVFTYG